MINIDQDLKNKIRPLNKLIKINNGQLYFVGGFVRDLFLKKTSKDIDLLVCDISQNALEEILKNFEHTLCGKSFGVYKVKLGDIEIDLALPRKERSIGESHKDFHVDLNNISLEEDLHRRDFTINSMAINFDNNQLIDPLNGLQDINSKTIRTNNDNSIKDDYLRALRGIQFASRFDFKLHKQTFIDIQNNSSLIFIISNERIRDELVKLLMSDSVIGGIHYLNNTGLLRNILPELHGLQNEPYNYIHHKYNGFWHTLHSLEEATKNQEELILRLAILFHDLGKIKYEIDEIGIVHNNGHQDLSFDITVKIMERLRFSNDDINDVGIIVKNHMIREFNTKKIRKLLSLYDYELTRLIIKMVYYDKFSTLSPMDTKEYDTIILKLNDIYDQEKTIKIKDLTIDGLDLISLGFKGKQIGDVLNFCLESVLDDPQLNKKEILLQLIRNHYAGT